jgi:hypothetical protein
MNQGSIEITYRRIDSIVGRVKRRLLTSVPLRKLRSYRREARIRAFKQEEASRSLHSSEKIRSLREEGACALDPASAGELLDDLGKAALSSLLPALGMAELWARGETIDSENLLASMPDLYLLGLARRLLDLAEAYIGQPCMYLGALLKLERADGQLQGTRQWHTDTEDERMLRIIIYLNDVGEGGGSFQYLPAHSTLQAAKAIGYAHGYLSDPQLSRVAPTELWKSVHGPQGTMIIFDGTKIFHRAQSPVNSERTSLTLSYTSRRPLELKCAARLSRLTRRELLKRIPDSFDAYIPRPLLM